MLHSRATEYPRMPQAPDNAVDREASSALLRNARDGSSEALDLLFERYAPRLLALIRARMGPTLRSEMESRDLLQTALLKAFRRIEQFEGSGEASLMSWLARIAENEIRRQATYQGREKRNVARRSSLDQADDVADRVRSQVSQMVLDEDLRSVASALAQLDEPYREIILLRQIEELSYREIGARLNKSPDACRMLLARAMTALAMRMGEES